MTADVTHARAHLNGLDLYYETRGTGTPVVVLHGAILVDLGPVADALAADHLVIAPHLQGRGHTPDIERPFDYESMADSVVALLEHLGVQSADIVGQSMGAGVALRVALRHPERVDRLVLVSTTMTSTGWHAKVRAELAEMQTDAEAVAGQVRESGLDEQYPEVDWVQLFRKTGQFQQRDYDLTADVRGLGMPALLVFADEDAVTPAHILQFWEALGGGRGEGGLAGTERSTSQLAIVPGTNHSTVGQSAVFVDAVIDYLSSD